MKRRESGKGKREGGDIRVVLGHTRDAQYTMVDWRMQRLVVSESAGSEKQGGVQSDGVQASGLVQSEGAQAQRQLRVSSEDPCSEVQSDDGSHLSNNHSQYSSSDDQHGYSNHNQHSIDSTQNSSDHSQHSSSDCQHSSNHSQHRNNSIQHSSSSDEQHSDGSQHSSDDLEGEEEWAESTAAVLPHPFHNQIRVDRGLLREECAQVR